MRVNKICSSLLALAALTLVTACGKSEDKSNDAATSDQTTIQVQPNTTTSSGTSATIKTPDSASTPSDTTIHIDTSSSTPDSTSSSHTTSTESNTHSGY